MRAVFSSHLAVLRLLFVAAAMPSAGAQITPNGERSSNGKDKQGNLAPHLVCTVCGERNYNLHDNGKRDDQGRVIAWCSRCKRDTSQRQPESGTTSTGKAMGKGGRLVLPTTPLPAPGTAE